MRQTRFCLLKSILMMTAMGPLLTIAAPDVERIERSIVRVVVGGHGTGWVVSPGIVATNWHVADGNDSFEIIPAGTTDIYAGSLMWTGNSELDLALISVPGLPLQPLRIHTNEPPRGSASFTTGFPGLGDDLTGRANLDVSVYGGTIALAVENTSGVRIIQHTNIVNAGNSGGPLLDECGRVLGLTTWGVENEQYSADFIWASMSVAELAEQMDRMGIQYTNDNSPCAIASGSMAPVDISGAVDEAVGERLDAAVGTATNAATTATRVAEEARNAAQEQATASEQRLNALTRQLYGWGAGVAAALALVMALALRRPRQQIIQAAESVSRLIRRSSGGSDAPAGVFATGSSSGKGLIVSGSGPGGELLSFPLEPKALEGQGISIGRDTLLVDFSIEDDLVSRRHVRFTWASGQVHIEDLNSTNGTFVNGRQLAAFAPAPLNVGDSIRLGSVTLAVSLHR